MIMGTTAIMVRKIAPARVIRLMVLCRKSLVACPGRNAGNIAATLFHVVGDLDFIELGWRPRNRKKKTGSSGRRRDRYRNEPRSRLWPSWLISEPMAWPVEIIPQGLGEVG